MKEWQRAPSQLVQEYCQKQKRPKPIYQNERAPAGQFWFVIVIGMMTRSIRVILPDVKNKEKDLVFVSTESFSDAILAKNCTCLLALHHLQPTLPLHQKMPEPYASMWLNLTGQELAASKKSVQVSEFVCPFCEKVFEKEMRYVIYVKMEMMVSNL